MNKKEKRINLSKALKAFTLTEIIVALTIILLAFIPIYRMFSYGSKGTASNLSETAATSYASDLINLTRELSYQEIAACMKAYAGEEQDEISLANDLEIASFFKAGLDHYKDLLLEGENIQQIEELIKKLSFNIPPMLIKKPEDTESEDEVMATDFKRHMKVKLFNDMKNKAKGVLIEKDETIDKYTALTFINSACIEVIVEYERSKGGPQARVTLLSMVHDYL